MEIQFQKTIFAYITKKRQQALNKCVIALLSFRLIGPAFVFCVALVSCRRAFAQQDQLIVELTNGSSIEGRLYANTSDRLAIETASQQLIFVPTESIAHRKKNGIFHYHDAAKCADKLRADMGPDFQTITQDGYVICSNAPEEFGQYVQRLLKSVREQFQRHWQRLEVELDECPYPLQVVIFRSVDEFLSIAQRLHPETSFAATPGFYSLRYNTMYVVAPENTSDVNSYSQLLRQLKAQPRSVETVVHEATHQLAYNTGLHQRYADVPLWFAEGLAMYFEPSSSRNSLLWSRPGGTFRYMNVLKQGRAVRLPFELKQLLTNRRLLIDDQTRDPAYAQSWAVVHYLMKKKPKVVRQLLADFRQLKPLQKDTTNWKDRLLELTNEAHEESVQKRIVSHLARLRQSR